LIDAYIVELSEPPYLDLEGRSYKQNDLVDIYLGLLEITTTKDDRGQDISIARIAHFSVQEYLRSDRIRQQKAARFAIQSESANIEMAQICLVYLLDPVLSSGALDEEKLRKFPFARFAAMYWYDHYQNSLAEQPKIESLLSRMFLCFTDCFATWIQLHDVDHPWGDAIRRMNDIGSPIYYAALLGLESIVQRIITVATHDGMLSAKLNARGGLHGTALQAASYNRHAKVVRLLLEGGADANVQCGSIGNALQAASCMGHQCVVKMLLEQGTDVNAQGGHYGSALHAASMIGSRDIVHMLLDKGANVNIQSGVFSNPLQAASLGGDDEKIVQMLLDRGANVNAQGGVYGNALQAASCTGNQCVVKLLLDQGADINAQGGYYGNAHQAASQRGHEELAQMLLDRGARLDAETI
jgi:ankyrin repeat protein